MTKKGLVAIVAMIALAIGASIPKGLSQDATTISRPNVGWNPGAICADGYALTFVSGQLQCVDSISRAEQANTATTATSATTAATAQQLDPNATVAANQISGQINAQQLQTPTCGSGQVLTNTGSGLTCVAAASSSGGGGVSCPAKTVSVSSYSRAWTNNPPYPVGPSTFYLGASPEGATSGGTFSVSTPDIQECGNNHPTFTVNKTWSCTNGQWGPSSQSDSGCGGWHIVNFSIN